MKLYKGLVAATVEALQDIFVKNRQADRVVEQLLKSNKKWGARDRAFIAENVYEIVRWWRLVKYTAQVEKVRESEDFWRLAGVWQLVKPMQLEGHEALETLPEWPEFEGIDREVVNQRYAEGQAIRKIAQSIPDWIDLTGEAELGERWPIELAALNKTAPVVLRVNSLKANIETVQEQLGSEITETVPGLPEALALKKRINVSGLESFKNGFFEVQDAGSQLIAPYLDVHAGMSVIDACAGAGGKSLHLAALLRNTGSVLAMDIEHHKLQELERRAARNGVTNLTTMVISSDKVIENLSETADRLLLDVPCSGLGVLRRNPDSKWKLKPEFLEKIRKVQAQILENYSKMVKKGGKMVYATCSVLPSESEEQVRAFTKRHKADWRFVSEHRTSPAQDGFDGFYMALLERK
ncbi:RsmB/NOP family class I SAM-dependent RNA methyltransferase [Dyadobacter endophyticus]|uniref:RsmB/NOP family class I SAM-dependent RNA methyltransferase n=1 Tax=Dyadobacter endophyticus TaxID=1749036 RepID=UPI003CED7457